MFETSFLETTASVSISIAGFVGIFLALSEREQGYTKTETFLIIALFMSCIPPFIYSALGMVLYSFNIAEPLLWRISSGIVVFIMSIISAYIIKQQFGIPREEYSKIPPFYTIASWLLITGAIVAHFFNVFAWPIPPSGGMFLLGLWLLLTVSLLMFFYLIRESIFQSNQGDSE